MVKEITITRCDIIKMVNYCYSEQLKKKKPSHLYVHYIQVVLF